MSMDLSENTVGVWFIALTSEQDFLLTITDLCDGKFDITYRFRYYNGPDAWDNADVKHWYTMIAPDTREGVIGVVKAMVSALAAKAKTEIVYEIINNGDFDNFMERFMAAPFVHTREASAEEIEAMNKKVN